MSGPARTTKETYNAAKGFGLFPEYNGLVGLIKALNSYATFNSFTMSTVIDHKDFKTNADLGEVIYGDVIDDLFPQAEANYVTNAAQSANEGSERVKATRQAQAKVDAVQAAYMGAGHPPYITRRQYLRDLLRYQAESIQGALLKKLNLEDAEELRNYLIPKGGYTGVVEGEPVLDGEGTAIDGGDSLFEAAWNYNYDAAEGTSGWYNTNYVYRNNQPFIRWDALAILINESLIPTNEDGKNPLHIISDRIYDKGNGEAEYISLNYASITEFNEETGKRETYDFSTDPNICILPTQLFYMPGNIAKDVFGYFPKNSMFPKEYNIAAHGKDQMKILYKKEVLRDDTKLAVDDRFSRIGNIFLNINMLNDLVDKNGNDEDYTIGNFINDIWREVNKVCPNHNFVLTDDKESNNIFIIDLPVDQSTLPKSYHTFIPFSNKNIFRDFEYTSNVPNALSATVAIQSQDPRSIQDIDGVTFAAFNKSIKNRILSKDTEPSWDKVKGDIESNASNLRKRRRELRKILEAYNINFIKNLSLQASGLETLGDSNIAGVLKEYQQSGTYIQKSLGMQSSFTSVIPLDFSATMDGISGIVIGNMFKIQKDRLPKAYSKADVGFIVFSEEQKITAGGDWTTDIGGKLVMLEQEVKYQRIPIDRNPPAVSTVEEKNLVQDLEGLQQFYALSDLRIEANQQGEFILEINNPDGLGNFVFEAPGPIYNQSPNAFADGVVIQGETYNPNIPLVEVIDSQENFKEFRITSPLNEIETNLIQNVYLRTPRIINIVFTLDTITMQTVRYAANVAGEDVDRREAPGDDIIILLNPPNASGAILREKITTGAYKDHFLGRPGETLQFPNDESRAERDAEIAANREEVISEIADQIHPDAFERDGLDSAGDNRLGFYIETQGRNKRVIVRTFSYNDDLSGKYTDAFTSEFILDVDPNKLIQFAKYKLGSEELIRDYAGDRVWTTAYKTHRPYKIAIQRGILKNPFA